MNLKKAVILVIAFVGITLFFYFYLKHFLTLATLKASPRVLGSGFACTAAGTVQKI